MGRNVRPDFILDRIIKRWFDIILGIFFAKFGETTH